MRFLSILVMAGTMLLSSYSPGWSRNGRGVELKATAEVEVQTPDAEGRPVLKQVPAEKVLPGTPIIYTIYYRNTDDQPAEHMAITNPIPEHMRYDAESAYGLKTAITFSVDGGKTFDRPDNLRVLDQKGKTVPARPADYTHIRWTLEYPIAPQASGHVGFRAVLE